MSKYGIGQPVLRFEDPRLLRGQGRYISDVNLHGQAYAIFVRSPHAHANIRSIDVEEAKKAPGVLAVYTGHDVVADGLGMPKANMPRKRPDGKPMYAPQRPPLITDRVRYVGDPVAMVIADTLAEAKDAAELVNVDYEPLPSVTCTADTVKPGAPAVWDDCPDNISNFVERGNKAATDEAIKGAAKVIKRRYVITRVHAQYMEPRGTLGTYDPGEDRMTLYADVQYPHRVRNMLAESALPYQSPVGPFYDCGEFEKNLDMALKLADVAGFAARKEESKKRGRLRGLGIINAIEQAAGTAQPEYAEIRFNPGGTAALLMGTKNQGQGHETMFKQILNERLGIDPNDVQYIDGDTDRVAFGMGTNGSRSTVLGGSALFMAAGKVIEKGKRLAGHMLEAGEQDIEFADGTFTVAGTDKS
ncbi:MAG: aerobic carbon-monoxide dehydrogenase large subunit, partial [Rhodospirillaceae bacterium]|nr:aerobic carbon-monoxide dehydrogenase large subunit [Rhodospirillaceae bacterium]